MTWCHSRVCWTWGNGLWLQSLCWLSSNLDWYCLRLYRIFYSPPRFLTEGRKSITKQGYLMFIVFSCSGLLSCIELCIFLCHLVLFVSTLAKWLAGKTYSRDIFCVEGFPLQRPDWRVIYCNGLLYVFPTRNIVLFLFNFNSFNCSKAAYLSKAQYSLFVLKVPLNSNKVDLGKNVICIQPNSRLLAIFFLSLWFLVACVNLCACRWWIVGAKFQSCCSRDVSVLR